MSDKHEPAFPATAPNGDAYSGMTLRDYFAAKAMQGMVTCEKTDPNLTLEQIAEWSYKYADAMLAERNK